ncbi:MAG: FAD-dependent oxidoreductase [Actinomycetota bacterium]|nr:FAD-dependent oxidoreductase [Actinomycetota bacterium]
MENDEAYKLLVSPRWLGAVDTSGAEPVIPDIPGAASERCAEARDMRLGEVQMGERALIVGAGLMGIKTADSLIGKGRTVTVVEEMDHSTVLPLTSHGYYLHGLLRKCGKLLLETIVKEVTGKGTILIGRDREWEIEADTVVWAVESRPKIKVRGAADRAGDDVELLVTPSSPEGFWRRYTRDTRLP